MCCNHPGYDRTEVAAVARKMKCWFFVLWNVAATNTCFQISTCNFLVDQKKQNNNENRRQMSSSTNKHQPTMHIGNVWSCGWSNLSKRYKMILLEEYIVSVLFLKLTCWELIPFHRIYFVHWVSLIKVIINNKSFVDKCMSHVGRCWAKYA